MILIVIEQLQDTVDIIVDGRAGVEGRQLVGQLVAKRKQRTEIGFAVKIVEVGELYFQRLSRFEYFHYPRCVGRDENDLPFACATAAYAWDGDNTISIQYNNHEIFI